MFWITKERRIYTLRIVKQIDGRNEYDNFTIKRNQIEI